MPQEQATRQHDIIDLTEGDDGDDQLLALRTAAKRAAAAATRLTSQFQSLATASKKSITENGGPVYGHKSLPGSMSNVSSNRPGNSILSQPRLSWPEDEARPRLGTFAVKGHLHHRNRISEEHNKYPKTSLVPHGATNGEPPTTCSPRAAAQNAGRVIAKTYDILNPLKERHEAKVTTPKKPGRPKLDQWTPKSHSSRDSSKTENRDSRSESTSVQPMSQVEKVPPYNDSVHSLSDTVTKDLIATAGHTIWIGTDSKKKRKRQSPSPDTGPPSKQPNVPPNGANASGLPNNDTSSKRLKGLGQACEVLGSGQPIPASTPTALALALELHLQSSNAVTMTHRYASSQQSVKTTQANSSMASTLAALTSAESQALFWIFESVVYPAITKGKKRHKYRLQKDDLIEIGNDVAREVVDKRLEMLSDANLNGPSDDQRREIKGFVKDLFHQRVLGSTRFQPSTRSYNHEQRSADGPKGEIAEIANTTSTSPIATSRTVEAAKIKNLPEYLRKLENNTLPADLEVFDTTIPVRSQPSTSLAASPNLSRSSPPFSMASTGSIVRDSPDDHAARSSSIAPQASSAIAQTQDEPHWSSVSPFPPGFDRGRYPAQRRRRANKYYNPTRPSRPSANIRPVMAEPMNEHKTTTKSSPPVSDDIVQEMWIIRVSTDPHAKALLKAVAGPKASKEQREACQELTDAMIRSGNPYALPKLTSRRTDLEDSLDSEPSRELSRCAPQSQGDYTRDNDAKFNPAKEKDQVRLLESLAHIPKMPKKPRQIDSEWVQSFPERSTQSLLTSDSEACTETVEAKAPTTGASDPHIANSSASPLQSTSGPRKNTIRSQLVPITPRLPATALDPQLERAVAVLITNEPDSCLPSKRRKRYSIDYQEQEELLQHQNLLKFANPHRRECDVQLSDSKTPSFTRIETKVIDPASRPGRLIPSLLRQRELGSDSRGRNLNTQQELRLRTAERIHPWRYWKGASGDIVAAAWGPDSTTYAVGAAAHTNPEDVQYNRPCNLLLGDLRVNTVTELPNHRVDRPKPETLSNTYNARQAVYDACDPMVYETVSSIAFSPMADRMYTASHDHTVKIWNTSPTQRKCLRTLHHDANVTSVEVSTHRPGLFATGSAVIDNSVRIYYTEISETSIPLHLDFSSPRAQARPDWKIYPECLRWGPTHHTSHLLLAGFHQNDSDEPPQEGQLCLWDVNSCQFIKVVPSSQSVLAAVWHPTMPFFATGGTPGGSSLTDKYNTKTVVRTWDLRSPKHYTMEYECSALDMQDITFHPTDSNIVTAGCTDGTSFVWDYRWHDHPVHRLKHEKPIVDWDHTRGRREEADTGVMMSLWGLGGTLFYTGSSDGMVKAWDIRRHPQDVLVRDVAQFSAGIQSGAISPDGTNLLVGDAEGGVHVLSSAPCGPQHSEAETTDVSPELPITLVRAPDGSGLALDVSDANPGSEGREAAKYLTDSSRLAYNPDFGVTQGFAYDGPYATYWKKEAEDPAFRQSQAMKGADNKLDILRTPAENKEVEDKRRDFIKARKQRISELYHPIKEREEPPQRPLHDSSRHLLDSSASNISTPLQAYGQARHLSPFENSRSGPPHSVLSTGVSPDVMSTSSFPINTESSKRTTPEDSKKSIVKKTIPERTMVEENYWWPRLGEDEIERARNGQGHLNFQE